MCANRHEISPDMIAVANRGGEWDETRGLLARLAERFAKSGYRGWE